MLFDGFLESLSTAKGHIQHKDITEKSKALTRAGRIVLGLQNALDFEKGGDLAKNLNELYMYVTRRLLHANIHNDLAAIDEVYGLMNDIRQAWETVPALVPPTTPRASCLRQLELVNSRSPQQKRKSRLPFFIRHRRLLPFP